MSAQSWITKMLDRHGVAYEDRRHEDAFTAQEVAEHEHFSGRRVVKVVVVVADDRMVELVMPANRQVSLERVREILNAQHVRLASEEEMKLRLSDAEVGAAPPLRHWEDVPIIMDKSMAVGGDILMQAGTHRDAVRVRFGDWFQLVQPRVDCFTVPAEPSAARRHAQECRICAHPDKLHEFLDDLLELLHDQAKEIERLTSHVERHTDRLLETSQMPVLVSEISDLRARLRMETPAH